MISLSDESIAKVLDQERTFLNTCELRLYTVSLALDGTQVAADFVEPTDSGYLAAMPVSPVFAAATLVGAEGQLLAPAITFTFSHSAGDFDIHGYWLKDPATGKSVYADDRAAGPVTISAAGDTYTVTPKKLMGSMA